MILTENFILQEFIDKPEYEYFGKMGTKLINPLIPNIAQFIREWFRKPVIINNWHNGGNRIASGLRMPRHKEYKPYSDHSRGNAFDFIIEDLDSLEIQEDILRFEDKFMCCGLNIMEKDTNGWTHVGNVWTNMDKILLINPK